MKFLFDGDGVLGVERWLGAGAFLDEVGFSVKGVFSPPVEIRESVRFEGV